MSHGDEPKKKDAPRWAADEPTAMWDGSSLEEQGLDASKKPAAPPAQTAPPQRAGLSWPLTIGIAIAVAFAVYFVVRALRG